MQNHFKNLFSKNHASKFSIYILCFECLCACLEFICGTKNISLNFYSILESKSAPSKNLSVISSKGKFPIKLKSPVGLIANLSSTLVPSPARQQPVRPAHMRAASTPCARRLPSVNAIDSSSVAAATSSEHVKHDRRNILPPLPTVCHRLPLPWLPKISPLPPPYLGYK